MLSQKQKLRYEQKITDYLSSDDTRKVTRFEWDDEPSCCGHSWTAYVNARIGGVFLNQTVRLRDVHIFHIFARCGKEDQYIVQGFVK